MTAASMEDLHKLYLLVQNQDAQIKQMQTALDKADERVKYLETDKKKQIKHGRIHFGKDLCPDGFDGKTAESFKAWKLKIVNYLSLDDNDRTEQILDWAGKLKDKITDDIFDDKSIDEKWDPDEIQDHKKFSKLLYRFLMAKTTDTANRIVQNGDPGNGVDAWRRLMFQFEPNLASVTQCHLKAILAIPRAKDATDAVSIIQKLDDLIRRYEKARNKELDEELKVQRMFDILPIAIEQHLVLEHRDKEPTFDDLRKRALTWIMAHTSGRAPMIDALDETTEILEDTQNDNEDVYGGDVMGFKGGTKGGKNGKGGFQGTCWVCNEYGHSAKFCPPKWTRRAKARANSDTKTRRAKARASSETTRETPTATISTISRAEKDSSGDHGARGERQVEKEAARCTISTNTGISRTSGTRTGWISSTSRRPTTTESTRRTARRRS